MLLLKPLIVHNTSWRTRYLIDCFNVDDNLSVEIEKKTAWIHSLYVAGMLLSTNFMVIISDIVWVQLSSN